MTAYYNEFDPFAAEWLRELIKDGLIANGVVDERSITDVEPSDLKEFTQCHFFAGIGGWSYAARLAGWPDDRPMWTGSPPCQPFSSIGNQKGQDDERHLWPVFFDLIKERKPPAVFGEQVAAAIKMQWFDDLQADMEKQDYATGMVVLPACSVGSPHKRDRLFYVAERMDNAKCQGLERYSRTNNNAGSWSEQDRPSPTGSISTHWDSAQFTRFRDEKCRPIPTEPALFPLAHGVPNRVGVLRGAGNAIVPQVAAEVIASYMES